jgi:hypothetical protein
MTHDYKRHGVTTLYAAMDVRSGHVIGDCKPRHRARGGACCLGERGAGEADAAQTCNEHSRASRSQRSVPHRALER